MADDITEAIAQLTCRVAAFRVALALRRIKMPLEIKGLRASMQKVAKRIESLNVKAQAFDAVGADLEQGLDDITTQAKSHHDDLQFTATVLGNSTSEAEEDKDEAFHKPGAGNGADKTV